jgi:hypothetical protein
MATKFFVAEREVIVDDEYAHLADCAWSLSASGYAMRSLRGENSYLHLEIFGPCEDDVDHRNLNKLDNRRENLRAATRSQNMANTVKTKANTSGFKGVSWASHANKFRARIRIHGKPYKHLGYFHSAEDAHEFYCLAADMLHGEFANHG